MLQEIVLSAVRADPQAQPRASINTDLVQEYTEAMAEGAEFPPIIVYRENGTYWLADGFHRFYAMTGLGLAEVSADVREGGLRDAILFSCSANAAHGQRRTNEDKRRAVMRLLNDPEWSSWANREIARRCGVDEQLVRRLRPEPSAGKPQMEARTVSRGGTTYQQNVSNIGRSAIPREVSFDAPLARPAPPPPAPTARMEQIARDNANGFISSALWEIERLIDGLPDAGEAIDRFPTHHVHTLSAERLREWSAWFSRAADAWVHKFGDINAAAE